MGDNEITVNILLEFLYNEFAVTFLLCGVGSFLRNATKTATVKSKKSKIINIKRIVTSILFSTFLMCACAEYIDLPFSVYAVVSALCGMWGLEMVNLVLNGKFMLKFSTNIVKKIANPLIKSAVESASQILEEEEKEENKDKNE